MFVSLLLVSLWGLAEGLRFYDSVGGMTANDISPSECFMNSLDYRCKHVQTCQLYIKKLDVICDQRRRRDDAVLERAQFDDYRALQKTDNNENPYFASSLRNMTVMEGESVTLRCIASGNPIPRVVISTKEMYRKLRYVDRSRGRGGRRGSRRGSARTSTPVFRDVHSEYTIFDVSPDNEGWYRCAAVNSHNYLISDGYITVARDPCKGVECGKLEVCVNEEGLAKCQCPSLASCSKEPLHPLCGNDCVSYFNLCTMKVQACQTGQNLTVWQDSLCPDIGYPQVNTISNKMMVQAGASLRLKCGARGLPDPDVAWYRVEKRGLTLMSEKDMLEIRDVSKDVKGKYVCMATNCINNSVRSNVVNVDVLDVQNSDRKVCHVFGDPHVTTFDGSMYSFVGACEYVITMDCSVDAMWYVYGRIRPCGDNSSCLQSITTIADGVSLQFLQGWQINNNGTEVIIAPGGQITIGTQTISYDRDGLIYRISLDRYGVVITWDGYSSATVIASKPINSCGLCGSYDQNPGNDVERSWFSGRYNNVKHETDSASEMVGSWKLVYDAGCPNTVAGIGAPFTNTCADEIETKIVEEECRKVLESDGFYHCMHSDEQIEFYTRACIRDTCGHATDWPFCEFVESIKQHCEQETEIPVSVVLEQCPNKSERKVEMIKMFL